MPVILAAQEAEIRRITVQSKSSLVKQLETSYLKKKNHKKGTDGLVRGVDLEFKPQHHKKTKTKK
jgi:hypothetical protein